MTCKECPGRVCRPGISHIFVLIKESTAVDLFIKTKVYFAFTYALKVRSHRYENYFRGKRIGIDDSKKISS